MQVPAGEGAGSVGRSWRGRRSRYLRDVEVVERDPELGDGAQGFDQGRVFPAPINLAATRNRALALRTGAAIASEQRASDPILASTSAIVDFVTRTVGWKVDARFNALSSDVNRLWDRDNDLRRGSVPDLREAVAADPKLR